MHLFVPIPMKGVPTRLTNSPSILWACLPNPTFNTGWSEVSLCWPISVDSYLIQQSVSITITYSL